MGLLITLIVLLVLAIAFFIACPIFESKYFLKNFDKYCDKKIAKIARKNGFEFLTNLNLYTYDNNRIEINSILFGKKYIYLLTNFRFDGDVKGEMENNSWILENRRNKECTYIDNVSHNLSEKTMVFSSKTGINESMLIPIAIVNNDVEIRVENLNGNNTYIVHYSSLKKLIKNLESRNIADLDLEQVKNQYEIIKDESNERNK